jgi:hypothetical protein
MAPGPHTNRVLTSSHEGTYVRFMAQEGSWLPDERLDLLYKSEGFGGETTMRARVIRELIDEIRMLRVELSRGPRDRGR